MALEEILVDIPLKIGEPMTISVNGVKGESCQILTRPLEQAYGEVRSDKATDEMYEAPLKQREQQRERI